MKFIAFILALGCTTPDATAADWLSVSAKAKRPSKALQPIVYSPDESVDKFNARRLNRDRDETLLVQVTLRSNQISVRGLVDRPAQFAWGGEKFSGRVAAAFVSGSNGEIQILAHVDNRMQDGQWLLPNEAEGKLRIDEPSNFETH